MFAFLVALAVRARHCRDPGGYLIRWPISLAR